MPWYNFYKWIRNSVVRMLFLLKVQEKRKINYVQVLEIQDNQVKGVLTNDEGSLRLPVRFTGRWICHFQGKNSVRICPDIIHVRKNGEEISKIHCIQINHIFGKTTIEGISYDNPSLSILIDISTVKELAVEDYIIGCDSWILEI